MKLSMQNESPLNSLAKIMLNDVHIKEVIEASEEDGYVIHFKRDANGNVMTNADCSGALTERLEGKVEIIFPGSAHGIKTGCVK